MTYLISAILSVLLLCSVLVSCDYLESQIGKEKVIYRPVIPFLTNEQYEKVLNYHGVKGMVWSRKQLDFIFKRDDIWCRAKAFELLRKEN